MIPLSSNQSQTVFIIIVVAGLCLTACLVSYAMMGWTGFGGTPTRVPVDSGSGGVVVNETETALPPTPTQFVPPTATETPTLTPTATATGTIAPTNAEASTLTVVPTGTETQAVP